jgi:Tol biopolymer transport system component
MTLARGTRLGPYTIDRPVGAGGMGEVYRARDERLQRDVAIKVLPEHVAGDADRRARLEREAQAVAALSHPNVLSIFDTGTHEGQLFVVTELLEGETLRAKLTAGPLPIRKAIDIGVEIARGLAAAHDRQIVHRDLKPENVFVLTDGRVKILDFGLARRASPADGAAETVAAQTDPGTVLGTVGYMAPEQVRDLSVDARTDLFAFGAVLYEMLTGRRAFRRDTAAETMTAILHEDPAPLLPARPEAPPALERIVRHCLEKNPNERFQSARDVAFALEALSGSDSTTAGMPGAAALPAPRSRQLAWIAGGGLIALGAVAAAWIAGWPAGRDRGSAPSITIGTAAHVTTDDGLEVDPALSPDGRLLAYAGGHARRMRVFIRAVAGGRTIPLSDGADPLEFQPRWSPDGSQILYLSGVLSRGAPVGGTVLVAPALLGGAARTVATGGITAAAWADDKRILVVRDRRLSLASLDGGEERSLGEAPEPVYNCQWSPAWIACARGNQFGVIPGPTFGNIAPSAIVLIPAAGGAALDVIDPTGLNDCPVWAPGGRELYFISNRHGPRDIYVVGIAPDGRAEGEPRRVTTGLGALSIAFSGAGHHLAYVTYTARANVWALPIPAGAAVDITGARQITTGNQIVEAMRVSRDDRWLLYDSTLHGNAEIFRIPVEGGPADRLTTDPADDFVPDLSPDGRTIAYHSWRTGTRDIFIKPLDGGAIVPVTSTPYSESYPVWSPDGTAISFVDQFIEGGAPRGVFVVRRSAPDSWAAPVRVEGGVGGGAKASWLDDRTLVLPRNRGIQLLQVDSGASRMLYAPGADGPPVTGLEVSRDGTTIYFKSHDSMGRASFWSIPAAGGKPRVLVRFTDLTRASIRGDFAVGAGQFFFTLEDRQADILVAEVTRRE